MNELWSTVAHLKDVASIVTPIAIAAFGLYINKSIQTQNNITERRFALSKQWADEFSRLAGDIYNTTLQVVFVYFKAQHLKEFVEEHEQGQFFKNMNSEIREIFLRLEEQRFRLGNYIELAPDSGSSLKLAFENLQTALRKWLSDKGGNADRLQELQTIFNRAVRVSHREILDLSRD